MATTLHESQGLRIVKNDRNGFVVARLHYTADPRKRSPEWREAARRGMSLAKFEQEFEINYNALLGEKVFPEIVARRHDIVSRTGPYMDGVWPSHLPMWGGFDYGQKNPSAFHIFTVVDGVTWCIWEMYSPCRNIVDFTRAMKDCPYWSRIRYIAHDPDMDNMKHMDRDVGVTSVTRMFQQLGVTRLLRGNTNEAAWLSQMQKHWCNTDVTFKILECCPMLIDEFEHATYVSMTERQLETQNYREALVDKHNHAMDAVKYFMNSGAAVPSRTVRLPDTLAGFSWSKTGSGSAATHGMYYPTPRGHEVN